MLQNSIIFTLPTQQIMLYSHVLKSLDQIQGHPQAIRTHKIKITIPSFILGQNFSDLLSRDAYYKN